MRLGIFGGTFDPIHYGHLLLAECCREQARLDRVWFVPNSLSPHKQQQKPTDGQLRAEMIELAIAGHEALGVCRDEIDRGGVSYSVETLERLAGEDPARELFFLLGADSLADLPTWRQPERICELASLVVVRRSGHPEPDFDGVAPLVSLERMAEFRALAVEMPRLDLSSSDLRRRVDAGLSIRYRTVRAVEKYIQTHGLYRSPGAEDSG
jgi:nicotinate-nucleotide adenylyltransferase